MKKLIIINILLLALLIPTIALARVVDYEEVTLDATEAGDRNILVSLVNAMEPELWL